MASLFGRLFRYRERSGRAPLEDYLSECLAEFFNRLPHEGKLALVLRVLLPKGYEAQWAAQVMNLTNIRIETQYPIPNGRLDLIVLADGHPIVAIENKISAPVAQRPDGRDQLSAYGHWLKQKVDQGSSGFGVICLLTHTTNPPADFTEENSYYGVVPKLTRWSAIADELRNTSNCGTLPLDVRTIAREFFTFLTEQDMTSEFAGTEDFAAAIVYVRAGTRMSFTFEQIFEHLSTLGGSFTKGRITHDSFLEFQSEQNRILGWKYLSAPPLKTLYFSYGIALKPGASFSGELIPTEDSAFICLGVETKKEISILESVSRDLDKSWHYVSLPDDAVVISFRPLRSVLARPEEFATLMMEWITSAAPVIGPLIAKLQGSA